MPPPPRPLPIPYTTKLYLKVHAKTVCEKAIEDAAKEINDIKQKTSNEVVDCTVSCDGSWQRRGVLVPKFVATVSMDQFGHRAAQQNVSHIQRHWKQQL